MNITEIVATVIHQFGHALGLGHALMKPRDWESIKNHVDVEKMGIESCDEYDESAFAVHWTGIGLRSEGVIVNYDDKSVMRYR
jgi:hypothetical protein